MKGRASFRKIREHMDGPTSRYDILSRHSESREAQPEYERSSRRRSYWRDRFRSPPAKRSREERSSPPKRKEDRPGASSHVPPPPPPPRVPTTTSSQLTTGDRSHERGKTHLGPSVSEALDVTTQARMEALKKTFPEIDFEKNKFVPNLKKIPKDVQDNVILCVQDAYAQYNEWYKQARKLCDTVRRLRIELDNSQQTEAQNDRLIKGLNLDLETERKESAQDALRTEKQIQKVKDTEKHLMGEIELANTRNHDLSGRVKLLEAQLDAERKEKESALEEGHENAVRAVNAEISLKEALDKIAQTEQRALDLEKEVAAAIKAYVEDLGATEQALREKWEDETDDMLTRYNANVIRFHSLRWYKDDHAELLAEAWEKVLEDKRADPCRQGELDEPALKLELLDDDEIEALHSWLLSHPKSTMEAGEASSSSLALTM